MRKINNNLVDKELAKKIFNFSKSDIGIWLDKYIKDRKNENLNKLLNLKIDEHPDSISILLGYVTYKTAIVTLDTIIKKIEFYAKEHLNMIKKNKEGE